MEEFRKWKRRPKRAKKHLEQAVERFSNIDPLRGHRVEALKLAREVRDEADRLLAAVGRET